MDLPVSYRFLTAVLALAASVAAQKLEIPADGPTVYTVRSGLKYSILAPGNGKQPPRRGDLVTFHCSGWLPDGQLVETTRVREAPPTMTLGVGMPKAWAEALSMMSPGARFKLLAPAELAYGSTGTKGKPPKVPGVPPDSSVVFDIELLETAKGVELRSFRLPDHEKQKVTASGLKFEVLQPGSGPRPKTGERYEVEFSLFNERAQLVATSRVASEPHITGRIGGQLNGPEFLREAIGLMRVGERMRFEVPPELCYGATDKGYMLPPDSTTIWELQLLKLSPAPEPRDVPPFVRPSRSGSQRTSSGLRYEVVRSGTGRRAAQGDRVEVHFAGWVDNGRLFDETYSRGIPLELSLSDPSVIAGWVEGLQLMRAGSIFRLAVPPGLAYGLQGRKDLRIGPYRTLYYQVELLTIDKARR